MKCQLLGIVAGVSLLIISNGVNAREKVLLKWDSEVQALKKEWKGEVKYRNIDGKLCGVVSNTTNILSKKLIMIEAGKKYILSGNFKSLGSKASKVSFGFKSFDKNKHYFNAINANVIAETMTTLTKECKKGDKIVLIKANKNWSTFNKSPSHPYGIAFNARDDFSDLPNYEIAYKVIKLIRKDGNMELHLSTGVKKSYPTGTKIRAQSPMYGTHLYTTIRAKKIPSIWTAYSNSATLAEPGQMSLQYLRPGTVFVQIILILNSNKKNDEEIAFNDLTLKVVE